MRLIVAAPSANAQNVENEDEEDEEVEEYGLQSDPTPPPRKNAILPDGFFSPGENLPSPSDFPGESFSGDEYHGSQEVTPQTPEARQVAINSAESYDEEEDGGYRPIPTWRPRKKVSLLDAFFVGTFSFPLHWKVQPSLLLMSMLGMPLLAVVCTMVELSEMEDSGLSLFSGGYFSGLVFVFGLLWSIVGAAFGLAILRDTSYDAENVEWPNLLMFDTIGDWIAMLGSLFYSALPGWCVVMLGHSSDRELWAIMAVSFLVFFPVALLSTLERNSLFHPFSGLILQSLVHAQSAWLLFYLLTFGLLGLVVPCFCYVIFHGGFWLGVFLGPVILSTAWMIYCRLLGRLTFFCSSIVAMKDPEVAIDMNPSGDDGREE
jgi:hypothetical protein